MKNIGIVFHPQICSDEMPKAEKLLEAIIVHPGTSNSPPICSFEGAAMQSMDSGGMYNVTPVWTKLRSGAWALNGLKVVLSPSQCLVGHDTLPLNDMNSARLLAFVMLMEMWVEHFDDNPLIEYFDVYNATLTNAGLAFYSVFPSPDLARNALLQAMPLWGTKFKAKNQTIYSQASPVWLAELPGGGCLKVSLGDAAPTWHSYLNCVGADALSSQSDELRTYSQRVIVTELNVYEDHLKTVCKNPWNGICRKLMRMPSTSLKLILYLGLAIRCR